MTLWDAPWFEIADPDDEEGRPHICKNERVQVVATRVLKAPPDRVFERVRRLDLMPERSPEPQKFEWLSGAPGEAGTSFRGWNKSLGLSWWTNGWITEVDAPQRFCFETSTNYGDRQDRTNRWTYTFEHHPEGTLVVESLETLRLPIHLKLMGPFLAIRKKQLRNGMERTLLRLAEECERPGV